MEEIVLLKKRERGVIENLVKGNLTGAVLICGLAIAAFYMLTSFYSDRITLTTGLVVLPVLLFFELIILRNIRQLRQLDKTESNLRETLVRYIDYFRFSHYWTMVGLGLSGFFVYILGSLIYHNRVHGGVYLDLEDILVNLGFALLAFLIGFFTHRSLHQNYKKELEQSLADLESEEVDLGNSGTVKFLWSRPVQLVILGLGILTFILLLFMYLWQ